MDPSTRNLVIIIVLVVIVFAVYSIVLFKYKRDDFSKEVNSFKNLANENKELKNKLSKSVSVEDIVQMINELNEEDREKLLNLLTKK